MNRFHQNKSVGVQPVDTAIHNMKKPIRVFIEPLLDKQNKWITHLKSPDDDSYDLLSGEQHSSKEGAINAGKKHIKNHPNSFILVDKPQ